MLVGLFHLYLWKLLLFFRMLLMYVIRLGCVILVLRSVFSSTMSLLILCNQCYTVCLCLFSSSTRPRWSQDVVVVVLFSVGIWLCLCSRNCSALWCMVEDVVDIFCLYQEAAVITCIYDGVVREGLNNKNYEANSGGVLNSK